MNDIELRPTYTTLTNEQRMLVYDTWAIKPRTFEEVKKGLPDLNLSNAMITECIDYGNRQINYFTNYRESEIRIVSEENKTV